MRWDASGAFFIKGGGFHSAEFGDAQNTFGET